MKYTNIYSNTQEQVFDGGLRDYMYLIYKNMGKALLISAVIAFIVGHSNFMLSLLFSNPIVAIIVQLLPLFFVFNFTKTLISGTVQDAKNRLFIFSALMGVSLSTIFVMYTGQSIVETFLTTSITFGCMSLYGYKTKKDLSSLQSFLFMGLCGLVIASLINLFIRSGTTSYILSCIGVIIFTLYTAYDVQNIRKLYNQVSISTDAKEKIAVFGALQLYLDFINLFLDLLRILNSRVRE